MDPKPLRIGILSDTHGRGERAARAAGLLAERGVRRAFHCGDIGDESVIDALSGLEMTYVLGNVDRPHRAWLRRYIRAVGAVLAEPFARCELAGRQVAVIHGDDARELARLIDAQELDYVFHGHTHVIRSERIGRTHVINPGALHRARTATVAVLAPADDRLEFLEL